MRQFKYFELGDFACPCCKKNEIKIHFVEKLDRARADAEIPFIPTSGYRCEKHNKEVGGSKTSSHLSGIAVDLKAVGSHNRYKIVRSFLAQGFTRIGIGKTFIHVDDDETKVAGVIWLY